MEKILSDIIAARKQKLDALGVTFGAAVPNARIRAMHPFPSSRGAIMELKRKSPSAGAINESLDIVAQAKEYAKLGAVGVSILTEEDYFLGSLNDLITVAKIQGDLDKTPLLRKDFLLSEKEVDVSYYCGADAVLLIARILNENTLFKCVARCKELGVTAFIEVHEASDFEKLHAVLKEFGKSNIAAGVNCRDLTTFTVDALYGAAFSVCGLGVPAIYESGVKSAEDAAFARALGYDAILVGEAVVRDVALGGELTKIMQRDGAALKVSDKQNGENTLPRMASALAKNAFVAPFNQNIEQLSGVGRFWSKYATRLYQKNLSGYHPMLKICGVTRLEDALAAANCGADLIGFIMAAGFKRTVTADFIKKARGALYNSSNQKNIEMNDKDTFSYPLVSDACNSNGERDASKLPPLLIAVITDPASKEANDAIALVKEGIIDAIQYHGCAIADMRDATYRDVARYSAVLLSDDRFQSIDDRRKAADDRDHLLNSKYTTTNNKDTADKPFTDEHKGESLTGDSQVLFEKGFPRTLIDSGVGSGKRLSDDKIRTIYKKGKGYNHLWLAGGVNCDNTREIIEKYKPELLDVSSGVESAAGVKDATKIERLCKIINGV